MNNKIWEEVKDIIDNETEIGLYNYSICNCGGLEKQNSINGDLQPKNWIRVAAISLCYDTLLDKSFIRIWIDKSDDNRRYVLIMPNGLSILHHIWGKVNVEQKKHIKKYIINLWPKITEEYKTWVMSVVLSDNENS